MKNNSEENRFRTWLKSNYGIQDYEAYRNTQTEELAIQFAAQSVREDRESRWISVKNAKPSDRQKLWFWHSRFGLMQGTFMVKDQWDRPDMFVNISGGFVGIEHVTHYQEFIEPSPPTNKG